MYVVASFQFSDGLETAVAELENLGINKSDILVVPLEKREENNKLFDTIYSSDGKSLMDLAAITGTIFMLLGAIYGFVLPWGPIFCPLIGLIGGALIGFTIDYFRTNSKKRAKLKGTDLTEVFLMIKCEANQEQSIKKVIWDQFALGVATLK